MKSEKVSFSRYGKDFQEKLCHLILIDRPFSDQIMEVLDIDFLELHYLRVFVKKVMDYRKRYETHPNYKTLIPVLKSDLSRENTAIQKQVRDYFARIYMSDIEGDNYIKQTALDFCRKQKLKEAMIKSVGLLNSSSYDEISKVINDALKLGGENDFGYDYLKDFEERFQRKARQQVSTGWTEVDDISQGGIGKGELGVVVAPTGAGKSMVLVHLGTQALKQGKTVVHYTLELSDTTIGLRYDSCLTRVPLSEIYTYKDLIHESVQELEGTLIIKEYPTKSATVNTIRNHLEKLKVRDINVDMVIVDYGDLLQPISRDREKRMELESIYEGMRGLAQEFNCLFWTASQTNRTGLNAEVITMESISEAFSKCFVADFIFTVSRTIEDKQNKTGRIFVAKNRFGPDGVVFPASIDWGKVKIDILPPTGEEIAEQISSRRQSEILKEKYQKFRKQMKEKKER